MKTFVKEIFANPEKFDGKEISISGWVRTLRSSNVFGFIEINDGTFFKNIQVVFESENIPNYKEIASMNVGAALNIDGVLVLTPEAKQPFEIKAAKIEIEGTSTPDYPLQKKRHSLEYLRTIAHLTQFTNSLTKEILYIPTHRLSPQATVKEQAKCSV